MSYFSSNHLGPVGPAESQRNLPAMPAGIQEYAVEACPHDIARSLSVQSSENAANQAAGDVIVNKVAQDKSVSEAINLAEELATAPMPNAATMEALNAEGMPEFLENFDWGAESVNTAVGHLGTVLGLDLVNDWGIEVDSELIEQFSFGAERAVDVVHLGATVYSLMYANNQVTDRVVEVKRELMALIRKLDDSTLPPADAKKLRQLKFRKEQELHHLQAQLDQVYQNAKSRLLALGAKLVLLAPDIATKILNFAKALPAQPLLSTAGAALNAASTIAGAIGAGLELAGANSAYNASKEELAALKKDPWMEKRLLKARSATAQHVTNLYAKGAQMTGRRALIEAQLVEELFDRLLFDPNLTFDQIKTELAAYGIDINEALDGALSVGQSNPEEYLKNLRSQENKEKMIARILKKNTNLEQKAAEDWVDQSIDHIGNKDNLEKHWLCNPRFKQVVIQQFSKKYNEDRQTHESAALEKIIQNADNDNFDDVKAQLGEYGIDLGEIADAAQLKKIWEKDTFFKTAILTKWINARGGQATLALQKATFTSLKQKTEATSKIDSFFADPKMGSRAIIPNLRKRGIDLDALRLSLEAKKQDLEMKADKSETEIAKLEALIGKIDNIKDLDQKLEKRQIADNCEQKVILESLLEDSMITNEVEELYAKHKQAQKVQARNMAKTLITTVHKGEHAFATMSRTKARFSALFTLFNTGISTLLIAFATIGIIASSMLVIPGLVGLGVSATLIIVGLIYLAKTSPNMFNEFMKGIYIALLYRKIPAAFTRWRLKKAHLARIAATEPARYIRAQGIEAKDVEPFNLDLVPERVQKLVEKRKEIQETITSIDQAELAIDGPDYLNKLQKQLAKCEKELKNYTDRYDAAMKKVETKEKILRQREEALDKVKARMGKAILKDLFFQFEEDPARVLAESFVESGMDDAETWQVLESMNIEKTEIMKLKGDPEKMIAKIAYGVERYAADAKAEGVAAQAEKRRTREMPFHQAYPLKA